jgi:energy-converting hydrogenase Eha subunit H
MQFQFHNYDFMAVFLELFPLENFEVFLNLMSWSNAAAKSTDEQYKTARVSFTYGLLHLRKYN